MKAIMVMFDSLNRHWLPPYGGDPKKYPNFARLARRSATFDSSFVCSMPCMPARRDLHTGRPNFLHSDWCPLQPHDQSMPQILKSNGISSHLITDHYHYFEDGGATYHNRYSTWQFYRGQEGDPWIGQVAKPEIPNHMNPNGREQDWVNRQFLKTEKDFSQVQTFDGGLDFLERNHGEDDWFLQIETFDPHEPFTAPPRFQAMHPQAGEEPVFDWPAYRGVTETPEDVARIRDNYSAVVSLCDEQLGRVLDTMDRHAMWEDTLLIVWTDHGFLLSEHGLWGKNHDTIWDEIGHTPFFVWDPRHPECAGQRRSALVQPSIDLGPTLLRFFGLDPAEHMTGCDLEPVLAGDAPVRDVAIYGYFNRPFHITDGRYCHVRFPQNTQQRFHLYTALSMHMRGFWQAEEMTDGELLPSLPFSNGYPVLRFPRTPKPGTPPGPRILYDLEKDPGQERPVDAPEEEARLVAAAKAICRRAHGPEEMLIRYGLA